jgi:hypothetical protein
MATANTVGRVVVLSMGIVAVCFMVVIAVAMIVVPMIVVPVIVIAVAMVVIAMIMVPVIVIAVIVVAVAMVVCRGSCLGARWLLGVTSREGDSVDAGDSQAQQGGETMILHDIH